MFSFILTRISVYGKLIPKVDERSQNIIEELKKTSSAQSLPEMRRIISDNRGFWLTVTGRSMAPFLIPEKDKVYILPLKTPPVRGQIVFIADSNEKLMLHRVCKVSGESFWLNGDAQNFIEGPYTTENIIGVMAGKIRGSGSFRKQSRLSLLLGRAWLITIRIRPGLHNISSRLQ